MKLIASLTFSACLIYAATAFAPVSTNTSDLLQGVWYGYNQLATDHCCIPGGTITFDISDGETMMTVSNWIAPSQGGGHCPEDGKSFSVPLNATATFDELPDMSEDEDGPEDENGYRYYVTQLQYGSNWPNDTQQVLLDLTIVQETFPCKVSWSKTGSILSISSWVVAILAVCSYFL